MTSKEQIYIIGTGAIGFPLAAYLTNAGRKVIAVRTSRADIPKSTIAITLHHNETQQTVPIETISLANLNEMEGIFVITAKSYANPAIAQALQNKGAAGSIVILQNGIGVEKPFLEAQFTQVFRCVLYFTSQTLADHEFSVRPITASPVGIIQGNQQGLLACLEVLNTDTFPFRLEGNIQREIWKKAIINAVFNSVCPLLEVDNGIFTRDEAVKQLAREIIAECVTLGNQLGLQLTESELLEQLLSISRRSNGQAISTLQDIRLGRPTEIESLNLEMARIAAALKPPLELPKTELLGRMVLAKSLQHLKV
jgi:2-dehydropantoate 2-reductase